ncbi:hypothetical protein EXU85_21610 [Spirosoma sp. KCTC 42546]|nr:hypothetical protein EXU85_21610 [Spirosoma sp. KCTC 42546]
MNTRMSWRQIAGFASVIVAVLVDLPLITLTARSRWVGMPGIPDAGFSMSRLCFHIVFTFLFIELNRVVKDRVTKDRYGLTDQPHHPRFSVLSWYALNFLLFLLLTGLFAFVLLSWYPERPILVMATSYFRTFFVWVTALLIGNFLNVLQQNRLMQAENQQLKQQSLQAQLDTLRNQLNPHFLFNSLNALSSLIREGEPKSQQYLAKLSQVLRYSLQVQQQSLVSFADELQFTSAFSYLLSIRFGSNLYINNQLPTDAPWKIPPMSLQLLIENAVKHNIVSTSRPLTIQLSADVARGCIIVRNTYQPKLDPSDGMGSGLTNLDGRFHLLTGKSIQILRTDDEFIVHLPIIPAT